MGRDRQRDPGKLALQRPQGRYFFARARWISIHAPAWGATPGPFYASLLPTEQTFGSGEEVKCARLS
jgi:hypothetical protein